VGSSSLVLTGRFVAVGIVEEGNDLEKLIGWEQGSIGYHGDDGKIYNGTGSNFVRCYEAYRDDDTVGCLINFYKNQVGFTKNGKLQGSTIQFDLTKSSGLLSAISSKSPTSSLKVNFGSRSFLFNIEGYVADQKRSFLAEIEKVPSNFPLDELTLICGYLKARGYFGTAKLLIETSHMTNIDFTSLAKEAQAVERDIFEKLSHLSIEPRAVKTSALEIALKQAICCIGHSFKVGSPEPSLIDPIISYIRIDS
jgi:hypothetical protein